MRKTVLALGVLLLLGTASTAQASIIYLFQGVTTITPGVEYEFRYDAELSPDQKISSAIGRNFGVIYDIGGFISSSVANVAAGLAAVNTNEALTVPSAKNQAPFDNPGAMNVRTELTGSFNSGSPATIYTVLIRSSFSETTGLTSQSGQAIKDNPGTGEDNTITGNTTDVVAPVAPVSDVPEPTTLVLLGSGLLGLAARARRRR